MAKVYKARDGKEYPLSEAEYDMAFKVFKSHRRKSKIADEHECFLARGIQKHPDVIDCYIGSSQDAYVIFKGKDDKPDFAVHFIVPKATAKIRDLFDAKGSPPSQLVMLLAPSSSQTLAARARFRKAWGEAVEKGKPVKTRGPKRAIRIERFGVPHRPRAKISRGVVEFA